MAVSHSPALEGSDRVLAAPVVAFVEDLRPATKAVHACAKMLDATTRSATSL